MTRLARLRPWTETAIAVAIALFALWAASATYGVTRWLLAMVATCAGTLAWIAAGRACRPALGPGPGIVRVVERRVAYMGPETGGTVSLDRLSRVAVAEGVWHLTEEGGERLAIPAGAAGADALFDVLAALPGLGERRLREALAERTPRTLWRRDVPRLSGR